MTVRQAHLEATHHLSAQPGLREHASRDAGRLLLHVLHLPRTALHAHPGMLLSPEQAAHLQLLIERRLTHEPIQYILGEQEFYGLPFHVTPATLIPRPETELLVEAVLDRLATVSAPRIVDVGTGSGAIAIALAHHRPDAHLLALDLSPTALAIAGTNAHRNGVAGRIVFRESDLLAALPHDFHPHAIVSNPPYIPEPDRATLDPQVRDHEPATALFAGPDGLALYRRLIPEARHALAANGLLALELGFGQQDALAGLLTGWDAVEFLNDLQAIPRVALARNRI